MEEASEVCSVCSRFRCILIFWAIAVLTLLAVEVVFAVFAVPDWIFRVFVIIWLVTLPVGGLFLWIRRSRDR
jgi:uncharacterized membrane protein